MRHHGWLFTAVLIGMLGCTATVKIDRAAEEQKLRDLHADVLRAHVEDDVEGWLAHESDQVLVASRGELLRPTAHERRAQRQRYLSAARFEVYRDLQEPVVTISEDGTLGWLVCQVEAKGTYVTENGNAVPIEFVSAWIEMYQKIDGAWRMVGNVSNFKPNPTAP